MSWRQDQFWWLMAKRDQARADERDALDREDFVAAKSAFDRQLRTEAALDKLRAKRRERD